jgi:hypothetical protein
MQQNKMQTIRGGTQNYVLSKKVFLSVVPYLIILSL